MNYFIGRKLPASQPSLNIIALIAVCSILAGCQKLGSGPRSSGIRPNVSALGTKGTAYTSGSLNVSGQSFDMIAVADGNWRDNATGAQTSAGVYFSSKVKYDGSKWDTYDATGSAKKEWNWINDVGLHFWSYYPDDTTLGTASRIITEPSAASNFLSFTYSLPTASAGSDASSQKDIIFAGNAEKRVFNDQGDISSATSSEAGYTRADNEVDIKFHHALSEIRFAVSPDDGTFDSNLTIKTIKLASVAGKANCKFTLPSTFVWSGHTSYMDCSQTVNASFSSAPTGWKSSTFDTNKTLYTLNERFYLIPQDASTVSIEVTFARNSQEVTKSFTLSDEWAAGCYYTYKINAHVTTDISLSISLLDWNYLEPEIDFNDNVSLTKQLSMAPATGKQAIADGGAVTCTFQLDSPIGATWFASVSNTEAFDIYNASSTSACNPAYGEVPDGEDIVFVIVPKSGVDRSKTNTTKVTLTLKLKDGTYLSIDTETKTGDWTIILNPNI